MPIDPFKLYTPKHQLRYDYEDNVKTNVRTTYSTVTNNIGDTTYTQTIPNVHTVEEYTGTRVIIKYTGPINIGERVIVNEFFRPAPKDRMRSQAIQEVRQQLADKINEEKKITWKDIVAAIFCSTVEQGGFCGCVGYDTECTGVHVSLCCCGPGLALSVCCAPCAYCVVTATKDNHINQMIESLAKCLTQEKVDRYWDEKISDAIKKADIMVDERIAAINRDKAKQQAEQQNNMLSMFKMFQEAQQHGASGTVTTYSPESSSVVFSQDVSQLHPVGLRMT